jgi:hypothetical protein
MLLACTIYTHIYMSFVCVVTFVSQSEWGNRSSTQYNTSTPRTSVQEGTPSRRVSQIIQIRNTGDPARQTNVDVPFSLKN